MDASLIRTLQELRSALEPVPERIEFLGEATKTKLVYSLAETLQPVLSQWLASIPITSIDKQLRGPVGVTDGKPESGVGYGDGGATFPVIGLMSMANTVSGEVSVGYDFGDQKLYVLASVLDKSTKKSGEASDAKKFPVASMNADYAAKLIGAVVMKAAKDAGLPV